MSVAHKICIVAFVLGCLPGTQVNGNTDLIVALDKLIHTQVYETAAQYCYSYYDGELTKVREVLRIDFAESGRTTSHIKCWTICMLRKLNFVAERDGLNMKMDVIDNMKSFLLPKFDGATINQKIYGCQEPLAYETNHCEIGIKFVRCLIQELKKMQPRVATEVVLN